MILSSGRQRAWLIDRAGNLDALRLVDSPIPEPGEGEVRIEVLAVGLDPRSPASPAFPRSRDGLRCARR